MPYDKRDLLDERGARCECGCGNLAHDAHHALIGRRKRFPQLDDEHNIVLVNHDEHILRKFDNQEWRRKFWLKQCDRYGEAEMLEWLASLPEKLRYRIDFLKG